jgi:hypothetical protein
MVRQTVTIRGLSPPDTPGPQVDASRYLGAMNTLLGKKKCFTQLTRSNVSLSDTCQVVHVSCTKF